LKITRVSNYDCYKSLQVEEGRISLAC
jgi:hypothetical protein